MALHNLARMTTATTGTGTITLGSAVTSYLSFADAGVVNAEEVTYAIVDGNARSIQRGVYTSAGTTLTRGTLLESTTGAVLSLTGAAEVFITAAAEDINFEGFRAYSAAAQTGLTSGAETQVVFGTEAFDVGAKFASNTWTPSAGKVFMHAQVDTVVDINFFTLCDLIIKKNGTALVAKRFQFGAAAALETARFDIVLLDDCDGDDAYTVYADFVTSAGTWDISSGSDATYFEGFWVAR